MPVRLYVGNLPEEVDRQALEKLFRSAGEVISTKVIRDRKTGKCRGFGFVTVNTEEQRSSTSKSSTATALGMSTCALSSPSRATEGKKANPKQRPLSLHPKSPEVPKIPERPEILRPRALKSRQKTLPPAKSNASAAIRVGAPPSSPKVRQPLSRIPAGPASCSGSRSSFCRSPIPNPPERVIDTVGI